MAVMTGLAIAGALASAYGASKKAKAQKQQQQMIQQAALPYNIQGLGGSTSINGKNVSMTLTPQQQAIYNQLSGIAGNNFGGQSPTSGFQQFSQNIGNNQMPGLFQGALDASNMTPEQQFQLSQQQGQGMFNDFRSQGISGLQGQANLFGQAQGLLNQDQSGLINSRLDLLRQQAAPYEARQLDNVANSAFARGQLGGPGGRLALSDFGDSLARADLGRQMSAQDLGMQAQQMNNQTAGLFGNLGSTLGNQSMQFASMLPGLSNQGYGQAANFSDLVNGRAQQRLQNATGLFGFGNELGQQDFSQGIQAMGAQQGLNDQLLNQLKIGSAMGTNQAAILAGQGPAADPWGAMASGFGNSLFNNAFTAKAPVGPSPQDMGGWGVRAPGPTNPYSQPNPWQMFGGYGG